MNEITGTASQDRDRADLKAHAQSAMQIAELLPERAMA
jgi:hypothetical protein